MKKLGLYVLITCYIGVLAGLVGCQKHSQTKTTTTTSQNQPNTTQKNETLPMLPPEILAPLFSQCNYVDVIYNAVEMSMSANDKDAFLHVKAILPEPADIKGECEPDGIIIYNGGAKTLLKGKFFCRSNCLYYIFEHEGKRYANKMQPSLAALLMQPLDGSIKIKPH